MSKGKSKRGRHQSAGPELDRALRWLESLEIVKKVVLGITSNTRHKFPAGSIRLQRKMDGGFKAKGYSGNGVVELFIRVDPEDSEQLVSLVENKFPSKHS